MLTLLKLELEKLLRAKSFYLSFVVLIGRIDYIFGPPRLEQTGRVEVLRDAAVGRLDHWPLFVEVRL